MKYMIFVIILFIELYACSNKINAAHVYNKQTESYSLKDPDIILRGECFIDTSNNLMWARNPLISFNLKKHEPDYNNNQSNLNLLHWKDINPAIDKLNKAKNKLCGYNDWRLPTTEEINTLIIKYQSDSDTYINNKILFNKPDNGYWAMGKSLLPMIVSFTDYASSIPDRTGLCHLWLVRTHQESGHQ